MQICFFRFKFVETLINFFMQKEEMFTPKFIFEEKNGTYFIVFEHGHNEYTDITGELVKSHIETKVNLTFADLMKLNLMIFKFLLNSKKY